MKRRMKITALILALAMTVTCIPALVFADDEDGGERYPWRVCFNEDSDYDWAHFYSVNGKDAKLSENELKISVLDEDGKEVDKNSYTLTLKHTWYDEQQKKDMEEVVACPVGILSYDKDAGFTEYVAEVTVTEDGNQKVKASNTFVIMDRYSLNWICAETSFDGAAKNDGWRMHERFWVALGKLKDPVVRTSDGTLLRPGKDYKVTYYRRTGDVDAAGNEEPMEDFLVKSDATRLAGIPSSAGGYFLSVEGISPYYGGTDVLLDVFYSAEDVQAMINAIDPSAPDPASVQNARAAFNSLSAEEQAKVDASKLLAAERKLEEIAQTEREAAADAAFNGTRDSSVPKVKGVKVKKAKKSFTVSWKKASKKTLKKYNAIEVQYSLNPAFPRTETVSREIGKKKKSLKVKGLTKGKTYYVRVRYFKRGGDTGKLTGAWSVKKVKIKK